jgi:hypothetical protein
VDIRTIVTNLLVVLALVANAYDFAVDHLCYAFNDDGESVTLSGYEPELNGDVVIPAYVVYNGISFPVNAIGNNAFSRSQITDITIPNSVTTIGKSAFYACTRLKSVAMGNSVVSIGNSAFKNCNALTDITIPNSVVLIDEYAFQFCYSLESVFLGSSVTTIGRAAFFSCSALTSVTIPNSVTTIS